MSTHSHSNTRSKPSFNSIQFNLNSSKNKLHRTPHISKVGPDIVKELILNFPDGSDPLRYLFGSNLSSTGAMKMSKNRVSAEVHVFYINNNNINNTNNANVAIEIEGGDNDSKNTANDNDINNNNDSTPFDLVSTLWSAVPCKEFTIDAKHFIDDSPLLTKYENRVKDFSSLTISAFVTASAHFNHPFLTLQQSNSDGDGGTLNYIGTWNMNTASDSNQTMIMTGRLFGITNKKALMNELKKIVYRWKQNVIDNNPDIGCLTIVTADDQMYRLESKLIQMLDEKEGSGFKDSGFKLAAIPHPILYALNHLIDTNRKKEKEAARQAKMREDEKKKAAKIAEQEARKKARKEKAQKQNELKRKADNDKIDGIENNSNRKSKSPSSQRKKDYVGKKVAKEFDGGTIYFGAVKEFIDEENEQFWSVQYEDGDREDMNEEELLQSIAYFRRVSKAAKTGTKLRVFTPTK